MRIYCVFLSIWCRFFPKSRNSIFKFWGNTGFRLKKFRGNAENGLKNFGGIVNRLIISRLMICAS